MTNYFREYATEDYTIYRVPNDINGNPRYVTHYLTVPYQDDETQPFHINQNNHIEHAKHILSGKKYRAKWFGGGIVFTTYQNPITYINERI